MVLNRGGLNKEGCFIELVWYLFIETVIERKEFLDKDRKKGMRFSPLPS